MKNRPRVRHELAKQQRNRCCYCQRVFGKKGTPLGATIEHKKPRSRGGTNARANLAAACLHCNQHRGKQMNKQKPAVEPELLGS